MVNLNALAWAHAGRKDYFWGHQPVLFRSNDRIDSAYEALPPHGHLIAGEQTCVLTLGPTAKILGDLAAARARKTLPVSTAARPLIWPGDAGPAIGSTP